MRSFLLIVSTICIVALGFGIYWMMEGAGGGSPAEVKPTRPGVEARLPGPSSAPVQGVEQVWMDRYDPKSGQRTSRMRVSRYEPQKDGSVLVSDPEVEFFLKGGRVLRLIGKTGKITTQEGISRGRNVPGGAAMQQVPRSGSLHDVKLLMLESAEAAEPTLTMTMNNAWFDNEAFKIYTEAYVDEKGQTIPGDKVPVIVVGRDYEFEGRGLRIQYNEVERRLDLLRVEHGKRLLVKNARGFRPARETERAGPATAPVAAGGRLALCAARFRICFWPPRTGPRPFARCRRRHAPRGSGRRLLRPVARRRSSRCIGRFSKTPWRSSRADRSWPPPMSCILTIWAKKASGTRGWPPPPAPSRGRRVRRRLRR